MADDIARRKFLLGLGAASGLALAGCRPWRYHHGHGRPPRLGQPGDRPNPERAEGTDLLPEVEHIVIYMQENHSYDSYFGMFHRGDGYHVHAGVPLNSNPDTAGDDVRVFHAPEECQPGRGVSQSWTS